jgi:hypothetical protein
MPDPLSRSELSITTPELAPSQPDASPAEFEQTIEKQSPEEFHESMMKEESTVAPEVNERPGPAPVAARKAQTPKDPVLVQIESVLEEDLTDLFLAMSPDFQARFKKVGEDTAQQIKALLEQTKVNFHKIFSLIKHWLKLIPGVNRFFLEQEAKIKTDKIRLFDKVNRRKEGEHDH